MSATPPYDEYDEMRTLVRDLGEARGSRAATPVEVARLRDFFAGRVLRSEVDDYILAKYRKHVEDDLEWPEDTSPEEYLESLRTTVLTRAGASTSRPRA